MLEFVPLVALALLVSQVVDLIKFISNGNKNGIVTTLTSWLAGVLVLLLFAQTDFASAIQVGDAQLDTLNIWSLVVIGLTLSSTASTIYNFKKALDTSDSAKVEPLLDS